MEDETILRLFRERSQDALTFLDRKYGKLLKHVAVKLLQDPRDAEEAVSDTYMKLWDRIPPEQPEHLLGYAAKLCRDAAIDALRRQTRQKRGGADVFYSELDECLPSGEDVAGALEARELAESISCYLRTLDADTRSMFVRRYFSMDELGELAADFGLTAHAVSARLYRVRQGLKAYLQKEGVVA